MTTKPPIIELRNVTKRFPPTRSGEGVTAVENLSLSIEDKEPGQEKACGEFVVLLGPSGCGKSTVLSLIAGLALPDAGEVRVFNQAVSGPHKNSATVPQAYTCFPWLNARENVEFGLRLQGVPEAQRQRTALEYLAKVDLADFAGTYHRQLSGGMQQRVAIARTLALKRPIVLMDEPFGALDAQTRAEMQQMLLQLWSQEKNTVVFVTHDITEALLLADRIIVFSARPARIIHDMRVPFQFDRPPTIVHEPEFIRHSEELRLLLRKHKPPPKPLPPPPGVGFKAISMRLKGDPGGVKTAPLTPPPPPPPRPVAARPAPPPIAAAPPPARAVPPAAPPPPRPAPPPAAPATAAPRTGLIGKLMGRTPAPPPPVAAAPPPPRAVPPPAPPPPRPAPPAAPPAKPRPAPPPAVPPAKPLSVPVAAAPPPPAAPAAAVTRVGFYSRLRKKFIQGP
jgi:NitT/TauT family transport system ATP-binding protein